MILKRLVGWESNLDSVIESKRKEVFTYGLNDCVLFTVDVVKALTGVDLGADFRGAYESEFGAARLLDGRSLSLITTQTLGKSSMLITFAQRGDVVLYELNGTEHLGICLGASSAFPGTEGLIFIRTLDCLTCWRIGG